VGTVEMNKITLKATVLASIISGIMLFVMTTLWVHQTDITILKTTQLSIQKSVDSYDKIPEQLARIEVLLENNAKEHLVILKKLDRR
jgi:hypothetical protein